MNCRQVLDYDLQCQVVPYSPKIKPHPSIYYPDFIAAKKFNRADNLIPVTISKTTLSIFNVTFVSLRLVWT